MAKILNSQMSSYSARILKEAERSLSDFLDLCQDLDNLSKDNEAKIKFYASLFERGMSREDKKDRREKLIIHLNIFEGLYNEMRPHIHKLEADEDSGWIEKGKYSISYLTKGAPVEKSRIQISEIFRENPDAREEFVYCLFKIFSCLNIEDEDLETVDLIIANYKPSKEAPESENVVVEVVEKFSETFSDEKTMGALKGSFAKLMENETFARFFNQAKTTEMGQQVMGAIQQTMTPPPSTEVQALGAPTPSQ